MQEQLKPCYFIIDYDVSVPPSSAEIAKLLEKGSLTEKLDAMKTLILMILQDEHFPRMIMTVVQHVLREDSNELRKLVFLYLEAIEKTNPDGTIKDEMVLLCNAIRNGLLSPNEFIRARTLRLVAKLRYRDLLDSLLQPVLDCLAHRHPYVRRNAVMCVYSIFTKFGEELMPDAVTRVEALLETETDLSARRNGLLFLFTSAPDRALKYLESVISEDEEHGFGVSVDILQLVVLDELRKLCKANPLQKGRHLKKVLALASTTRSHSVMFEAASTIIQLTRSPMAVKLAVSCYVKLLVDRSADSNAKLIILERLSELKNKHPRILQAQIGDLMKVLSGSSQDIRKCCMDLILDMVSATNIEEVLKGLKKELLAVHGLKEEAKYQELLVTSIHHCSVGFPDITGQLGIIEVLLDCCVAGQASDVPLFVKQLAMGYSQFRPSILNKVYNIFSHVTESEVCRTFLWLLAEYSEDPSRSIRLILSTIGPGPFINPRERQDPVESAEQETVVHRTVILPDGTYGTQMLSTQQAPRQEVQSGLRQLLTSKPGVDYYLVTVIAVTLTKLVMRCDDQSSHMNEVLLILCQLVQLRTFPLKSKQSESLYSDSPCTIDPDNFERVIHCLQTLTGLADAKWTTAGQAQALPLLAQPALFQEKEECTSCQFDDLLAVHQLKGRDGLQDLDVEEDSLEKLLQAEDFGLENKRMVQLTGLSDPVYVECSLRFSHFEVFMEFLVSNRSKETLQNLTIELATNGDLRIFERPPACNLGPLKSVMMRAVVKVNSTQAGVVFGNLTFDSNRGGNLQVIALSPLSVDTLEYIQPAHCSDNEFRAKWQQFTWESVVPVFAAGPSLHEFVDAFSRKANMQLLTPPDVLSCSPDFLVANLYARTRFAEDALANISLDLSGNRITGSLKVRTQSEGMVKSFGAKLHALLALQKH